MNNPEKPLVGISSCLTGQRVRYDGKDKFNHAIAEWIAPHVILLPICPEAAAGLGIPRPPVQLIEQENSLQAIGRDNRTINVTNALTHMGNTIAKVHHNLCGYIFQSRSPSCGFNTTPVFNLEGEQIKIASGLVAAQLHRQLPQLPIINDTDLTNLQSAEAFLTKVFQAKEQLNH